MSTSLLTQEILPMGNYSMIISQGFPQYPSLTVENQWRKLYLWYYVLRKIMGEACKNITACDTQYCQIEVGLLRPLYHLTSGCTVTRTRKVFINATFCGEIEGKVWKSLDFSCFTLYFSQGLIEMVFLEMVCLTGWCLTTFNHVMTHDWMLYWIMKMNIDYLLYCLI